MLYQFLEWGTVSISYFRFNVLFLISIRYFYGCVLKTVCTAVTENATTEFINYYFKKLGHYSYQHYHVRQRNAEIIYKSFTNLSNYLIRTVKLIYLEMLVHLLIKRYIINIHIIYKSSYIIWACVVNWLSVTTEPEVKETLET